MPKYKVLVIDDDDPIHFMTKSLLGTEFDLIHAKNAQEAINILSNTQVNLILSDIHMPGLTGLELLESLRTDFEKKKIPVLIMTNLPTVEKEKKALDLGAADFIKKELFTKDKVSILERVRMKLVSNIQVPDLEEELVNGKQSLVMELMETALIGDFEETVNVLLTELNALTKSNFTGFWINKDGKLSLEQVVGDTLPENIKSEDISSDASISHIKETRAGYFVNHIYKNELGLFQEFSSQHKLSAEISVPLFSVNEKTLLGNNMIVPEDANLFGILTIKRSVLFSDTEYNLVFRLFTQLGSILWRLYRK